MAYLTASRILADSSRGLSVQSAARGFGVTLTWHFLSEVNDVQLGRAFAEMSSQQFEAVLVDASGSLLARRPFIVELAGRYRLPTIYPFRDYVDAGGLMSYAPDLSELSQRIAADVYQILSGTRPGDIPIYQPNKFQLLINLRTAKTLGLELTPTLVARADEVIE